MDEDNGRTSGNQPTDEDGSPCLVPFCRDVFDSPMELEEHRHAAHPELYEEEEEPPTKY